MSLPYISDYAKSNQSVCRGCEVKIVKTTLRLAIMLQSRSFDGLVPNWYHFHCFFIEHMPESSREIENFTSLKWEDQQEIENIIAKGESPYAAEEKRLDMKRAISIANSKAIIHDYQIDNAKNAQTKCEFCSVQIKKDEIRIMKKQAKKLWYHLKCFEKIHTQIDFLECGNKLDGFKKLSKEDRRIVEETLPGIQENEVPAKKMRLSTEGKNESMTLEDIKTKENNDIMFTYREQLKENLNKEELAELLKHNRQSVPHTMDMILDRACEMLTFGALERCRKCIKGQLVFTNNGYKCVRGPNNVWSKCKVVQHPNRMFVDIPLELRLRHDFLYKYDYVERTRVVPKTRKGKNTSNGPLKTKTFILLGFNNSERDDLHSTIKSLSGRVVSDVRRSVFAIITTQDEVSKNSDAIQLSKQNKVYVVSKDFLSDLLNNDDEQIEEIWSLDYVARKHSLVDWGAELHNRVPEKYQRGPVSSESVARRQEEEKQGKRRMVIKGGIAIEPDSGLENVAHVYQSGACKFNAVLSRTNYTNNQNTYYKIQLLEADDTQDYWVYRAWGRIGTTVGSFNVKKMNDLIDAKREFKSTFEKMTGNSWEMRHCMVVRSGAYTLVDVNYDVKQEQITDLCQFVADSTLKPAVAELMAIIFNVQAMEKMMLEYQLDLSKMPLGKLSRSQIKHAYSILSQATWALQKNSKSKSEIIGITNLFYSHMPHNTDLARPPLLDNLALIKKKSEMLADLMELETAYAMIQRGAEGEGGNILDGYYKQLKTDIDVVQENSDEFKLIEEYVRNTHADTHRNYNLKILEIFKIRRNGEEERYEPYKKLNNRRLLWHGSRTTNFAGILSQGLRIAPPEAPQTGYMFGKGIYFADMVSKSANYCCTTPENRVGLMLLCEVALGNIQDKLNAETVSISTLAKGVNSVRGVGKTEPDIQAMKTLEDGVQIPLGKPVTDLDCNSSLLYNEYIVYDVSQVNIKYLLKMDFKFKF